jgi:hypothetical protein
MVQSNRSTPDAALLETALGLIAADLDAEAVSRGADDARRRAALLAHLAAWSLFAHDVVGQRDAEMGLSEVSGMHATADRAVARVIAGPENAVEAVLHLQILRLVWVHHALLDLRGEIPDRIREAALTTIAAMVDMLGVEPGADDEPRNGSHAGPARRAEAMLGRARQLLAEYTTGR